MKNPYLRFGSVPALLLSVASALAANPPLTTFELASPAARVEANQFKFDGSFDVFDYNEDGIPDILQFSSTEYSYYVTLNEGTTGSPKFGPSILQPTNFTETEPQTIEHSQSHAIGDLNGDGLFDVISFDGQLRMIVNTGIKGVPNHWNLLVGEGSYQFFPGSERMVKENARYSTGPESIHWNKGIFARQVLTLTVADWDGDGLPDLLISRFKNEAPGVESTASKEQWTPWGRMAVERPGKQPSPVEENYLNPLKTTPERGLYFYKNVGTKEKPYFDEGMEITANGQSIHAPNPVIFDVDGDGSLDVVSTETPYSSNGFRVDWPTNPNVVWYRRTAKEALSAVEAAQPVMADRKPVPAGTMVRFADMSGSGKPDMLVMDVGGSIRWHQNRAAEGNAPAFAAARELRGIDFLRFEFMAQPLIVNWFGPDSRDLIVHGTYDDHCKFALRRTTLYKNVGTKPGEVKYEFAGDFNFAGDLAMVPQSAPFQDSPYEVYGSAISVYPSEPGKDRKMVMSVNGQLYLFSGLAEDGLTFRERKPLPLAAQRNRMKGQQEITVDIPEAVKYIRFNNVRNGLGNFRSSMLHIARVEAISNGKNVATQEAGATVEMHKNIGAAKPGDEKTEWVERWWGNPLGLLDADMGTGEEKPDFVSVGYASGAGVVALKEAVKLDKIRFLIADRERSWYDRRLPFYWQGKEYRQGTERGEPWHPYKVDVSADGENWVTVADRLSTEMYRSFPVMVDWDHDGKYHLLLGVLNASGTTPTTKEYRLYRNQGTNEEPQFNDYQTLTFTDKRGKVETRLKADWAANYELQCGIATGDFDGTGKRSIILQGGGNGAIFVYRNHPESGDNELKFKELGAPYWNGFGKPSIGYQSRHHYFAIVDLDGDGVLDLIDSNEAVFNWFKGTATGAPDTIKDFKITAIAPEGVSLEWTAPARAEAYDIRWSQEPITNLTWPLLDGEKGTCNAGTTRVTLSKAPQGKRLYVAVKSRSADGKESPISDNFNLVTAPLKLTTLRNGDAQGSTVSAYSGCEAVTLDAEKPTEPVADRALLEVRRKQKTPKVVLVRFNNIPKTGAVERATLKMRVVPPPKGFLNHATIDPVACHVIRNDWNAVEATWQQPAAGSKWQELDLDLLRGTKGIFTSKADTNELVFGGRFLSFAKPVFEVRAIQTLEWDVTEAIREAQSKNEDFISLLLRSDYAGKYRDGCRYYFVGAEGKEENLRPTLEIISL